MIIINFMSLIIYFYDVYLTNYLSMYKSLWIQVAANLMNACKILAG